MLLAWLGGGVWPHIGSRVKERTGLWAWPVAPARESVGLSSTPGERVKPLPEPNLDTILAELKGLQARLADIPEDAFGERLEVQQRRRELHRLATELRNAGRSKEKLQSELEGLRRLRDEVFDRHLSIGNIGPGGGEGGGGIEVRYLIEVNRTIDEAWDLDKLNRQIRELEVALSRLPSDTD